MEIFVSTTRNLSPASARVGRYRFSSGETVARKNWVSKQAVPDSLTLHLAVRDPSSGGTLISVGQPPPVATQVPLRDLHRDQVSPTVLFVPTEKLPGDVSALFQAVQRNDDLISYCAGVAFCTHLTLDGNWVAGTTFLQESKEYALGALLAGTELSPSTLMFLNLFAPQGYPLEAIDFLPSLSYALGGLKLTSLLSERRRAAGLASYTFYAAAYSREIALALCGVLEAKARTFFSESSQRRRIEFIIERINQFWLPDATRILQEAYRAMPKKERKIFALEPKVDPAELSASDPLEVDLSA